jgi:hypothetical protein
MKSKIIITVSVFILSIIAYNFYVAPILIKSSIDKIDKEGIKYSHPISQIEKEINNLNFLKSASRNVSVDYSYYRLLINKRLTLSINLALNNSDSLEIFVKDVETLFLDLVSKNETLKPLLNELTIINVWYFSENNFTEMKYNYDEELEEFRLYWKKSD